LFVAGIVPVCLVAHLGGIYAASGGLSGYSHGLYTENTRTSHGVYTEIFCGFGKEMKNLEWYFFGLAKIQNLAGLGEKYF